MSLGLLWAGLVGCDGAAQTCEVPFEAWSDADGDGFGAGEAVFVCTFATEQADNPRDCDDGDPLRHPDALETCNAIDDNCNGQVDEDLGGIVFYSDGDGDGFGARYPAQFGCVSPGASWVRNSDDCNDTEADINPNAVEVCNEGIDDDCNGLADDLDAALDPSSQRTLFRDVDGDGYGRGASVQQCSGRAGYVEDDGDCDEANALVHPAAAEIPGDGVDQNCDNLEGCYLDRDNDGARTTTWGDVADLQCAQWPHAPDFFPIDCDDNDPNVDVDTWWYPDLDEDGYGGGVPVVFQCLDPGGGLVRETPVLDCDEADPDHSPATPELCDNAIDEDCDGFIDCDDPDCDRIEPCAPPCDPQREVLFDGRCYYLDGSTGQCDPGYVLAPQSILNSIAPLFTGLDYKNVRSSNCCIWHADQAVELQDWGMQPSDCNANGPFRMGPQLGGTGCTNALNMQLGQLTLCQTP